ncbi:MAG: hypothetical protein IJX81_02500 [Clostridia bacterium]|nr:hypothetical protein [Clostridia bacterium]
MKNFEVQHTLRLYDPDLVSAIGKMHERKSKEFRNKNEFLTELVKLGLMEMQKREAAKIADLPPTDATTPKPECADTLKEIYEILDAVSKYIYTQFKSLYVNQRVVERLMSSIYRQLQEMHHEDTATIRNADAGFYDDLPERFEKIIVNLKNTYGLK